MDKWTKILGLAVGALTGGLAGALLIGAVLYLSLDDLKRKIRAMFPNARTGMIKELYSAGLYNEICIGLKNEKDNKQQEFVKIQTRDYDQREIYVGRELDLTA